MKITRRQRFWWMVDDFFFNIIHSRRIKQRKMQWRDYVAAKRKALDDFEMYWSGIEGERANARRRGIKTNDFKPESVANLERMIRRHEAEMRLWDE